MDIDDSKDSYLLKLNQNVKYKLLNEGFDANVDFGNKDIGNPANINESGGDDNGDDNSHNPSLDEGLSEHYENKKRR